MKPETLLPPQLGAHDEFVCRLRSEAVSSVSAIVGVWPVFSQGEKDEKACLPTPPPYLRIACWSGCAVSLQQNRVVEPVSLPLDLKERPADSAQVQAFFQDVHAIADALARLADHFVPPPADIVDTTYVAGRLGCGVEWISQQAKRGRIPKSCILEGSGNGKPWKFRRLQIDEWIANR